MSSGFQIEAGGNDSYYLTTKRNYRRVPTSKKNKGFSGKTNRSRAFTSLKARLGNPSVTCFQEK
jgi:hypothetical protein